MAEFTSPTRLSRRELRRYSRHLLIPEVALAGQERLAAARVLVIGAGGLGSPAIEYLAAAGIGRIGIADDDVVDETNLQRQTIFATSDLGRKKVDVAAERVAALNPHVAVDPYPIYIDDANADEIVAAYDVVLDCTDRFASRYAINDACVRARKPDVYASIFRFDAQVSVFDVERGPCYRCLFPIPPPDGSVPTCAEGGVLGVLAGIAGTWQANEALKVILNIGKPLIGRLMLINALDAETRIVTFTKDESCPRHTDVIPSPSTAPLGALRTGEVEGPIEISASELDAALKTATLLDLREPHEAVLGSIDGAIVIPASQLEARMHELDTTHAYVVACRLGQKSLWAYARLHDAGFRRLQHLHGGLLAYAAQHDDFAFF